MSIIAKLNTLNSSELPEEITFVLIEPGNPFVSCVLDAAWCVSSKISKTILISSSKIERNLLSGYMSRSLDSFQVELIVAVARLSRETKYSLDLRKLLTLHLGDGIEWEACGADWWVSSPDCVFCLVCHCDIVVETEFSRNTDFLLIKLVVGRWSGGVESSSILSTVLREFAKISLNDETILSSVKDNFDTLMVWSHDNLTMSNDIQVVDDIDLLIKLDLWVLSILLRSLLLLDVLNLLEVLESIVPEFLISRSLLDFTSSRLLDSLPNGFDWGAKPWARRVTIARDNLGILVADVLGAGGSKLWNVIAESNFVFLW
jgi:hypothetical protein